MQWAKDEVIGAIDADLSTGLVEVCTFEFRGNGARPSDHLVTFRPLVQKFRRPAAPLQRTTADRVQQTRASVTQAGVRLPRHAHGGSGVAKGHVLKVLGDHQWPNLQYKNS